MGLNRIGDMKTHKVRPLTVCVKNALHIHSSHRFLL